jgi:hypothetical protein
MSKCCLSLLQWKREYCSTVKEILESIFNSYGMIACSAEYRMHRCADEIQDGNPDESEKNEFFFNALLEQVSSVRVSVERLASRSD